MSFGLVAKDVSCPLLFLPANPCRLRREEFGDSRKNMGEQRKDGIVKVLQDRGQLGHQHTSERSGSAQLIPSPLFSGVGIESRAA